MRNLTERQQIIVRALNQAIEPVSAQYLSSRIYWDSISMFEVPVATVRRNIAALRDRGYVINRTPRGYELASTPTDCGPVIQGNNIVPTGSVGTDVATS